MEFDMTEDDATCKGGEAFMLGLSTAANPFNCLTKDNLILHGAWTTGWIKAAQGVEDMAISNAINRAFEFLADHLGVVRGDIDPVTDYQIRQGFRRWIYINKERSDDVN
jgi:hypothetical protein